MNTVKPQLVKDLISEITRVKKGFQTTKKRQSVPMKADFKNMFLASKIISSFIFIFILKLKPFFSLK